MATAKKAAATPPKDKLSATDLAIEYNYAYALLMSSPELKTLFTTALNDPKGQWTSAKFAAKLRTTKWYRNHSESWRTTETLRVTDPTEYATRLKESAAAVKATAASMGATLTDAQITSMATTFFRGGYSDAQMKSALSAYINPEKDPGGLMGQAGQVEDALRQTALRNGQRYSDDFYLKAARAVAGGTGDIQQFMDQIRGDAASTYPVFSEKIAAGMDVADLASGYINKMAQTFEIDPGQVTLDDPYIKKALGGMDQAGNPTAMGMWDFEKALRGDPRWAQTKQAKDASDNVAYNILKSFGFQA